MRTEPVFVALLFYSVIEVDRSRSGGPSDFAAYYFATGTVQDYPAEQIASVKRQKDDDCPVVLVIASGVDVSWFFGVSRKTLSNVECAYRWYRAVGDDG